MEAVPSVLYAGYLAPRVGLRLTNPTCGSLSIKNIRRPDWIKLDSQPSRISAGETAVFYARADTYTLSAPAASSIEVETAAGSASAMVMAIAAEPKLEVMPDELTLWADPRRAGHQRLTLHLGIAQGYLSITGVKDSTLPWMSITSRPASPVVVSSERVLLLEIEVDPAAVGRLKAHSGELTVEYESPFGPQIRRVPLQFVLRNAPQLRWAGRDKKPATLPQADRQHLILTFVNGSDGDPQGGRTNAPVVLENVTLVAGAGQPGLDARLVSPLPRSIPGGKSCQIEFQMNLEPYAPAIHQFALTLHSSCPELNQPVEVSIEVEPLRVFDGIMAIDFGTSNTCCAILENGGSLENIPLDGADSTAPTVVRYLDLKGKYPEIETGVFVKNQAAVNEEFASSIVDRLKQQLGAATHYLRIRPANTGRWVRRDARAAASDYLHHIRVCAERTKGRLFREFILTHPAVCPLRQYRNLRFALLEAFGGAKTVSFLQEPIAALIPFFDEMAQKAAYAGYLVAAFDLGGGTTDITVVQVDHRRTGDAVQIQPRILASWGERFGGEDLTDFLVEQILARCKTIQASKNPGFELAANDVFGASTPVIRRNEAMLRDWAEKFKATLSEDKSSRREPDPLILVAISKKHNEPPQPSVFDVDELGAGLKSSELRELFLKHCRGRIERLARRLERTLEGKLPLTYIHLSGKTTFLAVVKETLESVFPASIIVRAEDPKECVVRGACLSRAMARSRLRRLILPPESHRTTSSIGLMDDDTGAFLPVIELDRPIPTAGLAPDAWYGRDVVVVRENLSNESMCTLADGTPNPDLKKLGTWEPLEQVDMAAGEGWALRFSLSADLDLTIVAVGPNGRTVAFQAREGGGF